jgi:hypothetical protein
MPRTRTSFHALLLGLLVLSSAAAKDKKAKPDTKDPQDQIEVVGHIALTDGPVRRFVPTQHYSSHYLYAEHEQGKLTLIDVTKAAKPAVLADVTYPASGGGSSNLFAVTGTAALVAEGQAGSAYQPPVQTIRIMDFSDPQNPKVDREFVGVTAMSRDESRGLIFIANPEGVWILRQRLAEDPEVERAYAHHVVYDH